MFGNKCLTANRGLGTKRVLKGTDKIGLTASLNKLLRCSTSFIQIKGKKDGSNPPSIKKPQLLTSLEVC